MLFKFIFILISFTLSLGAFADWTSQFVGSINFRLTDDPEYTAKMNELRQLEAKEIEAKRKLDEKQRELKETSSLLSSKRNALDKAQDDLEAKTKSIADAERKIPSIKTENTLLEQKISNAQSQIQSVQNIIISANQELVAIQNQKKLIEQEISGLKMKIAELQRQCDAEPKPTPVTENPCPQADQLKERLSRLEYKLSEINSQMSSVETKLADAKSDLNELQNTISQSKLALEQNNREIASLESQILTYRNQLPEINTRIANLSREVEQLKLKEQNLVALVNSLDLELDRLTEQVKNERNEFAYYQKEIENQILSYNQKGVNEGRNDGTQDGNEVSKKVGTTQGYKDGRNDGLISGERAGRDRDYKVGIGQGEIAGSKDGLKKGEIDGESQGIKHGNQEAGRRAGVIAGTNRANISDAAVVGEKQGRAKGLETAIQDGKNNGYEIGESEVIEEKEGAKLNELIINGQFAGTFTNSIPSYPGPSRAYFNNQPPVSRTIFAKAYIAGYDYTYPRSAESQFHATIKNIYQNAYEDAHEDAHREAYSRDYADSRQQGYNVQYRISYDREYDRAYDRVHSEYYTQYLNKPQTQGEDYKVSYKNAERDAYNDRYEEIRSDNYDRFFQLVYDQNIGPQTEKYRLERRGQVEIIYANNSALKFVDHSYVDSGINSIGVDDGIYMPEENMTHSLTVINYGSKAATNVKVLLSNGKSFTLPAIPGVSQVKILGAAKHNLSNASLGSIDTFSLRIAGDLNTEYDSILGRHYEDRGQAILKSTKKYSVSLQRPLKINHVKTLASVFYDSPVKLQAFISNISKKNLKGSIKFELESSLGVDSIVKTFSSISEVPKDLTLEDAVIQVKGEENLFSTISFKLNIKANDVLVASSDFQGTQVVKAPYVERNAVPVIVFNSNDGFSRDHFKDLLKIFGGMKYISILDLSGESNNQEVLDTKMSGKSLIIVLDQADSVIGRLSKLYEQKSLALAFYLQSENVFDRLKLRIPSLEDSTKTKIKIDQDLTTIFSTTTLRKVKDVEEESKISAILVNDDNVYSRMSLMSLLKLKDNDLGNELIHTFNQDKFLAKSPELILKGKVMGLRVLEDFISIHQMHEDAQNRRERRHARKYIKKEEDLLINKFAHELKHGDLDNRVALSFYAYPIQHGLSQIIEANEKLLNRTIKKRALDVMEDFDKIAKKNLTKQVYVQVVDEILKVEQEYYLY